MTEELWAYGWHTVESLLHHTPEDIISVVMVNDAPRLLQVVELARQKRIPTTTVSRARLTQITQGGRHQGIAAHLKPFVYADFGQLRHKLSPQQAQSPLPLWLVLDQVQDPHNLGALLRSAYVMGANAVIIAKDRACDVTAGTLKSASGAARLLPLCKVVNLRRALQSLREDGVWLIGTCAASKQPLWQIDCQVPLALVMGAEEDGLRMLTRKMCDYLAQIPCSHPSFSLNVAVAGGIALYEICRQRQKL